MLRKVLGLVVVLSALLLSGSAEAQDFIRYYPPAGVSELSGSGTAITSTVPILLPAGTAAAPALAFSDDTDLGFYKQAAYGIMHFVVNGASRLEIANGYTVFSAPLFYVGTFPNRFVVGSAGIANNMQIGDDASSATAQTIKGPNSTGANNTGASLTLRGGAGTSGNATGGQLILGGGANAGTGERGAVAFEDGGTKPTCAAGIRGSVWYDAGGAGVADTFEVCAKAAADSYAWHVLATIP